MISVEFANLINSARMSQYRGKTMQNALHSSGVKYSEMGNGAGPTLTPVTNVEKAIGTLYSINEQMNATIEAIHGKLEIVLSGPSPSATGQSTKAVHDTGLLNRMEDLYEQMMVTASHLSALNDRIAL